MLKKKAIHSQTTQSELSIKKLQKDFPKLCKQYIRETVSPTFYRLLQGDLEISFSLEKKQISMLIRNPKLITRLKENYLPEIEKIISQSTPFRQISILTRAKTANNKTIKKKKFTDAKEKDNLIKKTKWNKLFQHHGLFLNDELASDLENFIANPHCNLFIFGLTGNGKSSLAKLIVRNSPQWKYLTAERFVEEFAQAARARDNFLWRKKIRAYPRILIDNFQYWKATAKYSQEELIHLIDVFKNSGKSLIIFSSIRLQNLTVSVPLKSRLQNFEELELSPPVLKLRKKIFSEECNRLHIRSKPEISDFLCRKIVTNMRLLKSAARRLKKIEQRPLLQFPGKKWNAHFVDLYSNGEQDAGSVVLKVVAEFFQVEQEDILSNSRQKQLTRARHISAYICTNLLRMKYQETATLLNRKQHGTIIHACKKIDKHLREDLFLKDEMMNIQKKIKQRL